MLSHGQTTANLARIVEITTTAIVIKYPSPAQKERERERQRCSGRFTKIQQID